MFPRFQWVDAAFDPQSAASLAASFGLPLPVAGVLASRGLSAPAEAGRFLDPKLQQLGDPLAFPGVAAAAERIARAITRHEPIIVFGDFDADGVIATAVLSSAIRALGGTVTPFLPDRVIDGYGLTPGALARCLAAQPDARLLVTVDCGINAAAEVAWATTHGCEVIVTDHHEPDDQRPAAVAVVNPKLPGTPPEAACLCGAGVAFKLVHALVKLGKQAGLQAAHAVDPRDWLDAVAVATVADVVPLSGENRVLVTAGLRRLRERPCVGLKALMHRAGVQDAPTSYHLAFMLGPRLNAAGRMLNAWPALNLLQADDWDAAVALAVQLEHLNAQRKTVEAEILAAALEQLGTPHPGHPAGGVVAGGVDWHPGAIGIVASRLAELWNRPAAVVALDAAGAGRGSVRAGRGYDALAALKACGDTLAGCGGHRQAAGFRLKAGALAAFRGAFGVACAGQQAPGDSRPVLTVDGWLRGDDVSAGLWQALQRLEPFGEGHSRPRWGVRGARLTEAPTIMGGNGDHVRMTLDVGGSNVRAVWWKMGAQVERIRAAGSRVDAVIELTENTWRGGSSIEFQLVDVRPTA
jgi:single-stranded-DNA-specific exonuclease